VLILLLARSKNTDVKLQEAVLLAMAALSKENASVGVALGRGLGLGPDGMSVPFSYLFHSGRRKLWLPTAY
jgi:hypothetical protein